ncbi:acyltransferase [Paenibacillus thalictri]|uniref:Acyltransferase n=1 Tax=Paenibacillus thalictri TaxID=2527873 RepID=A0A4Q9DK20_9BACL|nr:acyltransferase [Paenibacillus thalictri]TBL75066.1 acyltransferase [Paenibacillus thalictri]
MAKTKLLELEIVRAFAILAVLLIHGTSEATVELELGGAGQSIYLGINKLSNFAVPVFLMLSGLVLFYRYSGDWSGKQALVFYRRRIQQIVIPYLVWSLFYYFYDQWLYNDSSVPLHFDGEEFLDLLPWADASYHLYYIIIIVQFYLLFPLLMWGCTALGWFRRWLWLIGAVIQAAAFSYNHWGPGIDHFSSLCIDYFSLFALGGSIGMYYETFIAWMNRYYGWVIALAMVCGVVFAAMFELEQLELLAVSGLWYALLFVLYAMFACVAFIWIGRWLLAHTPGLARVLIGLGAASFGIYLVHPAVLSYWRTHFMRVQETSYDLFVIAGFLLSLIVPWLLASGYGKISWLFRRKKQVAR